jgi:hypothetical protein
VHPTKKSRHITEMLRSINGWYNFTRANAKFYRSQQEELHTVQVYGQVLNNSAKYLGLNIHKTLSWDEHINKVTQKAHNTLSFSSRNISCCPQTSKPNAIPHLWYHIWNKHGTRKYKFLVIGKQDTYFVRHHSDSPYKYSEADTKSMLGFLVDNIYVVYGDQAPWPYTENILNSKFQIQLTIEINFHTQIKFSEFVYIWLFY